MKVFSLLPNVMIAAFLFCGNSKASEQVVTNGAQPLLPKYSLKFFNTGDVVRLDINDVNTKQDYDQDRQLLSYKCVYDNKIDGIVQNSNPCSKLKIAFNGQTGRFNWTAATSGEYEFKFFATDGQNIVSTLVPIKVFTKTTGVQIANVVGGGGDNGLVSIDGINFGFSPKMELFDDFERGQGGAKLQLGDYQAYMGNWTSQNTYYKPTFDSTEAVSGRLSLDVYDETTSRSAQLVKNFSRTSEFFISYWVKIPSDSFFPGSGVTAPGMFSTDSSWKFSWLMLGDRGDNVENSNSGNDVCIPSHVSGNGTFAIGGNHVKSFVSMKDKYFHWWSWGQWMRVTAWLKADPQDPLNKGKVKVQTLSEKNGLQNIADISVSPFQRKSSATVTQVPAVWDRLKFPGWIRGTSSNTKVLHDDVYIATGPNAQARVEIGNASTYEASTKLTILPVLTWSTNKINAVFKSGPFKHGERMYLYVFDSNGVHNNQGIEI